jgi:hypothetical protein
MVFIIFGTKKQLEDTLRSFAVRLTSESNSFYIDVEREILFDVGYL